MGHGKVYTVREVVRIFSIKQRPLHTREGVKKSLKFAYILYGSPKDKYFLDEQGTVEPASSTLFDQSRLNK